MNLEKMKNEILNFLNNDNSLTVFYGNLYVEDETKELPYFRWDFNNDYKQFLKIAKFVEAKIIYFQERSENDLYGNNNEELAEITFIFFHNGIQHALVLESDRCDELNEEKQKQALADLMKPREFPEEKIPEDKLCKNCKKNRVSFLNLDYCDKCIVELKEQAEEKMNQFAKEISEDPEFTSQPNEAARTLYVKDKYKEEHNKNKFIFLKRLSQDAFALFRRKQLR